MFHCSYCGLNTCLCVSEESWAALSVVRIEPYEEKYIKFMFLEPAPFFYVQEGGSPHVGFEEPRTAEVVRSLPNRYTRLCNKTASLIFEKIRGGVQR